MSRTFMPEEGTTTFIQNEAERAPGLVWVFWRKEKSPVPAGNWTSDRPANNLVTDNTIPDEITE
jgi:hypothetical protein